MAAHAISDTFRDEFLSGKHKDILSYVHNDDTLDIELRGSYVSIYYRGGAILKIAEDGAIIPLDKQYLTAGLSLPDISNINDYLPKAKHIIDKYVRTKRNHLGEKEIQQLVVKENNYSCNSFDTDYFIIDMEYQEKGRFDLVAIRWDSTSNAHKEKSSFIPALVVIEVKQGYNSVGGDESNLAKHYEDFKNFIADKTIKENFIEDMLTVFRQKRQLGLIDDFELDLSNKGKYKDIDKYNCEQNIEFVGLLANYKKGSTRLEEELTKIGSCNVFRSHYMGYGLFASNIENLTANS